MTEDAKKPPMLTIHAMDLVNALALTKAKEAGLLGKVDLREREVGAFGAMMTEVQNTTVRLENNEITEEQAKTEIEGDIWAAIKTIVGFAYDAVTVPIVTFVLRRIPPIATAVEVARRWVKHHVVEAAIEIGKETVQVVKKGWNWLKNKVKSVFA
jgi:hypothetical protein